LIDEKAGCLEAFLACQWAKDQKFDLSILQAVSGRRISVGELISHLVSVKSVENVVAVLSDALGQSVVPLLRRIHDRWSVEVQGEAMTPMISDLDGVFATLVAAFKYRHILAHEPAEQLELSEDEIGDELRAAAAFVSALDEIVGEAIYPNAPLTQSAMNEDAAHRAQAAEDDVHELLSEAPHRLEEGKLEFLGTVQKKWQAYRDAQAELEGLAFEGGSMRPLIESGAREALARSRVADIRRLFEAWGPP
jgi:uncharacterized protein YecT (DUF1311 family)